MSQKDRDRLKVLHEAEKGLLTQKQAGMRLRLSERRVRNLLTHLREGERRDSAPGAGAASGCRLPLAVRQKVVKPAKPEYADFGPTLAAKHLAEQHGVLVSKGMLRQIPWRQGVWNRKRRWMREAHVWQPAGPAAGS
jgi:hypothetical protein